MQPKEPKPSVLRPFGEPLDPETLEEFAEVGEDDMDSAESWWDRNASPEWIGALDNEPIGKRKRK